MKHYIHQSFLMQMVMTTMQEVDKNNDPAFYEELKSLKEDLLKPRKIYNLLITDEK